MGWDSAAIPVQWPLRQRKQKRTAYSAIRAVSNIFCGRFAYAAGVTKPVASGECECHPPGKHQEEARNNMRVLTITALVSVIAAMLLLIGTLLTARGMQFQVAEAIPNPQETCAFDSLNLTTASGFVSTGTPVTIDNGTSARRVIVQMTANAGVDEVAEIRLAYAVDGGAPQENVFGPANLANHQEFFETRATFAIIPLPAGVLTIEPFVRISGAPGKNATLVQRCFFAEGRTR